MTVRCARWSSVAAIFATFAAAIVFLTTQERPWAYAATTGLLICFILWLYVLPSAHFATDDGIGTRERLEGQHNARLSLVQAVAGLALLGGLFFTSRNLQATNKTLALNRDSLANDRYTKALELLGNDKVEVRIGAVYALESLQEEGTVDRKAIDSSLTGFLQEYDNLAYPQSTTANPVNRSTFGNAILRGDFQAILTVLGRQMPAGTPLKFFALDLSGADMQAQHFERDNFYGSLMTGAELCKAHFDSANLGGVTLDSADLRGASFRNANLEGANLQYAALTGADFTGADTEGLDLRNATISGVIGLSKEQIRAAQSASGPQFAVTGNGNVYCSS